MKPVSILIVDDHPVIRQALRNLLIVENWHVCAEAADGLEAIEAARQHNPDVIIMDVSMPRMSGIQAAIEIQKENPAALIMLITAFELTEEDLRETGVRGSVTKIALSRIPDGIRAMLAGEKFHLITARPDLSD